MSNDNVDFQVEDFNFDDVPDAPNYRTFPAGAHRVTLKASIKTNKTDASKRWVQVSLSHIATVEVDPSLEEENLPKAGDISSVNYYIFGGKDGGEYMRSELKKIAEPIGKAIGNPSFAAFLEACKDGLEGTVVVSETPNTYNGKTTMQQKIQNFILA